VYASLAMETLRSGDLVQAREILSRISGWQLRDRTLHEAARLLQKQGRQKEALDFAKAISNWQERDAALVELTR